MDVSCETGMWIHLKRIGAVRMDEDGVGLFSFFFSRCDKLFDEHLERE